MSEKSTAVELRREGKWSTASLIKDLAPDVVDAIRRDIITLKANGRSWPEILAEYPVSQSMASRWWRESQWDVVDTSPEGLAAHRQTKAAELRALNDRLWERLGALDPHDPKAGYLEAKLHAEIRANSERESKLLGLDAALKVEHKGRIKVTGVTEELEALVAELAGGGVLLSNPEIVDAETLED